METFVLHLAGSKTNSWCCVAKSHRAQRICADNWQIRSLQREILRAIRIVLFLLPGHTLMWNFSSYHSFDLNMDRFCVEKRYYGFFNISSVFFEVLSKGSNVFHSRVYLMGLVYKMNKTSPRQQSFTILVLLSPTYNIIRYQNAGVSFVKVGMMWKPGNWCYCTLTAHWILSRNELITFTASLTKI